MIEYIYFVKCPDCEDEHFDFFDEAKGFALGCLSKKPIITQTEVCRNDFGECTDSTDLGTVWSWEDECGEVEKAPEAFNRGDFAKYADGYNPDTDPEFATDYDDDFRFVNDLEEGVSGGVAFRNSEDFAEFKKLCDEIGIITVGDLNNFMKENGATDGNVLDKLRAYRAELGPDFKIKECKGKPVPEGMTIEQLVEEMEENEDEVECTWCNDLFSKDQCRKEVDLGYLCSRCEAAIKSRGEKLTFIENDYWDFLDEAADRRDPLDHHDPDYDEDEAADYLADLIDSAKDDLYDRSLDTLDEAAVKKNETVNLEYGELTVTVYGSKRDVDDWDEADYSDSFTYKVDKDDVANTIWENFITEEDAADVPGGLETLEDTDAWKKFLEENFDKLFDKYYDKLLDYYKDDATTAFEDTVSWDDYEGQFDTSDDDYDRYREEQDDFWD